MTFSRWAYQLRAGPFGMSSKEDVNGVVHATVCYFVVVWVEDQNPKQAKPTADLGYKTRNVCFLCAIQTNEQKLR